MQKVNKILEIAYLVIAIVFLFEAISILNTDNIKALMYGAFAIMAVLMFFLKRKIRNR